MSEYSTPSYEHRPSRLRDFAYLPGLPKKLDSLAAMALPEPWAFASPEVERENMTTYLIERHLYMTFEELSHLREDYRIKYGYENKSIIFFSDALVAFNTGLATPLYQDIYAVFEPNANPIKGRRWRLTGFYTDAAPQIESVTTLPKPLRYFAENGGFHSDYPIRFNLEHMLSTDNLSRIPAQLRGSPALPILLQSCAEQSMRKAAVTPGIVVPQWYDGKKQYLLPLYMTSNDTADIALTLDEKGGYYHAHTALTMEMAYCRARLLSKPEAKWLTDAIARERE